MKSVMVSIPDRITKAFTTTDHFQDVIVYIIQTTPFPYPQIFATCCPREGQLSNHWPLGRKKPSWPADTVQFKFNVWTVGSDAMNSVSTYSDKPGSLLQTSGDQINNQWQAIPMALLVVWYQIWPVCSWLEWHHSSSDSSWSSCTPRHWGLREDIILKPHEWLDLVSSCA